MRLLLVTDRTAVDEEHGRQWGRGIDARDRTTWHLLGCDYLVELWNRRTQGGVCSCPRAGAC